MNINFDKLMDYVGTFFNHPVSKIVIGAVVLFFLIIVMKRVIRSFFNRTDFIEERKEQTLESMFNSLLKYVATFGFIIYVFSVFEFPVGKVLAGAGVLGIIIGLGAQSMIKDLLAGIFLLYEKQLNKGDWVQVNNTFEGIVEDVGLRFLKVRQWAGELLTISNGQIETIENYNINEMRVVEHVTVSFYEDPKNMFRILEEASLRLNEELDDYLKKDLTGKPVEPFQLYGMSSLNNDFRGYQYTVTGLCNDLLYWTAAKETRRIIAEIMYANKIQMAEQHMEVRSQPNKT